MDTVLITVHLIIVLFLIVVVLLQRSEGGGLGIGGGGGMTTSRSRGDGLTRTTGILAAAFFVTSLGLGIYARYSDASGGVFDRIEQFDAESGTAGSGNGILDALGPAPTTSEEPAAPAAPVTDDSGVPTGQ